MIDDWQQGDQYSIMFHVGRDVYAELEVEELNLKFTFKEGGADQEAYMRAGGVDPSAVAVAAEAPKEEESPVSEHRVLDSPLDTISNLSD